MDDVYCLTCGYRPKDELDMLAHLVECPGNPEEKWLTYIDLNTAPSAFKNSEILEETK